MVICQCVKCLCVLNPSCFYTDMNDEQTWFDKAVLNQVHNFIFGLYLMCVLVLYSICTCAGVHLCRPVGHKCVCVCIVFVCLFSIKSDVTVLLMAAM